MWCCVPVSPRLSNGVTRTVNSCNSVAHGSMSNTTAVLCPPCLSGGSQHAHIGQHLGSCSHGHKHVGLRAWLRGALVQVLCGGGGGLGSAAACCWRVAHGPTYSGHESHFHIHHLPIHSHPPSPAACFLPHLSCSSLTCCTFPFAGYTLISCLFSYRGVILPTLLSWMSPPAAVALSSLAFGASHLLGPLQLLPLTGLGAVLALSTITGRGNLVVPTVAHGAYNLSVLLLAALADQ